MRHFFYMLISLTLLAFSAFADSNASYPPHPEDSDSPTSPVSSITAQVALEWITLLDQMRYDISWSEAGSMLKDSIARNQWMAAMDVTRRPLGYVSSRKVRSQTTRKILNYGTVGMFMIIKYDSSFLGRSSAVETCTLMREKDNSWRVVSYDVR